MYTKKTNMKWKKALSVIVIVALGTVLISCSAGDERAKLAEITFPENIFGTDEIGITDDELFQKHPNAGNLSISRELIDGENLYIYNEVQFNNNSETTYYYYVYGGTLVGTATEYKFKKCREGISDAEFLTEVSESLVSLKNTVEQKYNLSGLYDGTHYKYDGDTLTHKPLMNGMWRGNDSEIYIATSLTTPLTEYDDTEFSVLLTYGAVTTDRIGQETALDVVEGNDAEHEEYVEDRLISFEFKPDGENTVECKFMVSVYKETVGGVEETFVCNVRYAGQYSVSCGIEVSEDECDYVYTQKIMKADVSGTLIGRIMTDSDRRRFGELNYVDGHDGRASFSYSEKFIFNL